MTTFIDTSLYLISEANKRYRHAKKRGDAKRIARIEKHLAFLMQCHADSVWHFENSKFRNTK